MKINKFIYFISLAFLFTSCSDYLDVKDAAAINSSIWNNAQSAELYVDNIYSECMPSFGGDAFISSLYSISDETTDMPDLLRGTLTSGSATLYSSTAYEPIRYCDLGLEAMQSSTLSTDAKKPILGQLYFFRAWQQWKLINTYGGVPYMRHVVTFSSDSSLVDSPRNTTSQCIAYLKQDLDSAIADLPATWPSDEYSRITRAAAAAFKGRVLLYYASPQYNPDNLNARWKDAYDANLFADSLCLADGYKLMDISAPVTTQNPYPYNFNKIFTTKIPAGNHEALIVVPYYTDIKTHSYENSVCPSAVTSNTGAPSECPTWDLVISFPMKDGSVAFKYNATNKNERTFIGNGGDIDKYYLNRDPRFYSTIAFNGSYYELQGDASRRQWMYTCPDTSSTTYYAEDVSSSRMSPTGFYCRKMVDPTLLSSNMDKSTDDWIVMRYAEVLMNLAEASYEYNNDASGVGLKSLEEIRARAGIDPGTDGTYGLSQNFSVMSPIEVILNERRCEFAFEGLRFYDLRRWNMFTNDLGSYIHKLNGWKKSGSGYQFTLKDVADTAIFLHPALRDTVKFADIYKYFTLTPKSVGPLVKSINYQCVTNAQDLKNTTTGSYNFFDIPENILTRSPAIEQTNGWDHGNFDPFE